MAGEGALEGVRILDLTDERGIYGAKLLADLGADVVRPEPPDGDPLRSRGPHFEGEGGAVSLWHLFFASNRRFVTVDIAAEEGRERLAGLIARADVVLYCEGALGLSLVELTRAREERPELIVVDLSSFGREGPWRDFLAPDLVAGALGGVCATTGDVDTPPLKCFGELNFIASGSYAAIAALTALYARRETGEGQLAEISVHETIASCLEHVFMFYWYHERVASADGPVLARQGGLHWTKLYDVVHGRDGTIMVTLAPAADAILAWLIEEDAHQDLLDEANQNPERPMAGAYRMMQVLREWVATQDVETLFFAAQERHCPFGAVMPMEGLAENPQLAARDWWQTYRSGAGDVKGPGAPYHLSETPWALAEPSQPIADADVLSAIGWEASK